MSVLQVVIAFLIVLGPLVAIHEFGHFWVARRMGVKVLTYSIGFGPSLFSWHDKQGTRYQVAAIPLGGYVRMADEREGEVPAEDVPRAFNRQPVYARMAIVAAGPLINLFLAFVLYWFLFLQPTEVLRPIVGKVLVDTPAQQMGIQPGDTVLAVDGQPVKHWEDINYALIERMGESGVLKLTLLSAQSEQQREVALPLRGYLAGRDVDPLREVGFLPWQPPFDPIIGEVLPDGAGARQGLQAGDRIVSVDGQPVVTWQDFTEVIRLHPEEALAVGIKRGDALMTLVLTPAGVKDQQGVLRGKLGIALKEQSFDVPAAYKMSEQHGPLEAIVLAAEKTWKLMVFTLESIGKMLQGLISVNNLSGPITIAKVAGQSADMGWEALLGFMALLSVSLGVLNLLPIPVLDGGHLVYLTAEAVLRRPVSERVQMMGVRLGLVMLMSLMVLALFNDLSRL